MTSVTLSADEILAIPPHRGALLFPGDRTETYRRLVKTWHPDLGGRQDVFDHIMQCKRTLDDREVLLTARTGSKQFRLLCRRRHPFELGEVFVGMTIVAYHIEKKYEPLALRGVRTMNSIKYPDGKMKDDLALFFPTEKGYKDTMDGSLLIVEKTKDVVMLRDLIDHLGGAIEPRHVMWIISSLLNLVCFLSITKLVHNGLTTESVFVSPKNHAAFILGGWWYAAKTGEPITALPPGVHAVVPRDVLLNKTADHRIDLESIRAIGRACIGSNAAVMALPKPFANWLRLPAPPSPIDDYAEWERVREAAYGPRRFLAMNIDGADVYP